LHPLQREFWEGQKSSAVSPLPELSLKKTSDCWIREQWQAAALPYFRIRIQSGYRFE
jgi:hypothetical protein